MSSILPGGSEPAMPAGNHPLRIIFMGTAPLAAVSLGALADHPAFRIVSVVTQPDKPRGRDLKLQPSAVKELALAKNLPVLQPLKARDPAFFEQLSALQPELIVVAAYGQILPQSILDLPRHGCLNVHTSLLPKYRGAAPIQWAIANGDLETGVTIMRMDAGLDTGDIVSVETTPIQPSDDSQSLHDRLAHFGATLLTRTIPSFVAGNIIPQKQPAEGVSYARKIEKEDGHLDWTQPARVLWNRLRAFTPWPGAFTFLPAEPKPLLLKIWQAEPVDEMRGAPGEVLQADKSGLVVACREGALRILTLQREGGRRMSASEFLTGSHLQPGTRL